MSVSLIASAAYTAAGTVNGTGVLVGGYVKRIQFLLDVTAVANVQADTLDVYADVSPDGTKWINAVHFAQILGNGAALSAVAQLDPSAPGTAVILTTSDCAVGVVRPSVWGKYLRGRYVIVDGGAHAQSFTFSLKAYVQ